MPRFRRLKCGHFSPYVRITDSRGFARARAGGVAPALL
jgi:hypothetical protein